MVIVGMKINMTLEIIEMDIHQINSAIMFGDLTDIELNSIIDAVKFRRKCLVEQSKRQLTIGSEVTWPSTKRNITFTGTVIKIAQKYVTVKSPAVGTWKVPANMISVI